MPVLPIATDIGSVYCLLLFSMSAKNLINKNLEFYVCTGIKIKKLIKFKIKNKLELDERCCGIDFSNIYDFSINYTSTYPFMEFKICRAYISTSLC